MFIRRCFVLGFLTYMAVSPVHGGQLRALAGANFTSLFLSGQGYRNSPSRNLGLLGGVALQGGVGSVVIELSGIYSMRAFQYSVDGAASSGRAAYALFPARWIISPLSWLSLGLGPYIGVGVGKYTAMTGSVDAQFTFNEAGLRNNDVGGTASVRLQFPNQARSMLWTLESAYFHSALSASKYPSMSLRYSELQCLAGIGFVF
jgi:hypothetical protein